MQARPRFSGVEVSNIVVRLQCYQAIGYGYGPEAQTSQVVCSLPSRPSPNASLLSGTGFRAHDASTSETSSLHILQMSSAPSVDVLNSRTTVGGI